MTIITAIKSLAPVCKFTYMVFGHSIPPLGEQIGR